MFHGAPPSTLVSVRVEKPVVTPAQPPSDPPALEPPALEPPALEPPALEPPVLEPPALEPPALEPPVPVVLPVVVALTVPTVTGDPPVPPVMTDPPVPVDDPDWPGTIVPEQAPTSVAERTKGRNGRGRSAL